MKTKSGIVWEETTLDTLPPFTLYVFRHDWDVETIDKIIRESDFIGGMFMTGLRPRKGPNPSPLKVLRPHFPKELSK